MAEMNKKGYALVTGASVVLVMNWQNCLHKTVTIL